MSEGLGRGCNNIMQPKIHARNRSKEGNGKSEKSYIKHGIVRKVVLGQINAFRATEASGRVLLIDGNAGDGDGVPQDQFDLFEQIPSIPTPRLLFEISKQFSDVDLMLCEKNKDKRLKLMEKFPDAVLVGNNKLVHEHINGKYQYALWLSDPCGPAGHGHESMCEVGRIIQKSDFIIVFNAGWIRKRLGNTKSGWETARKRYMQMLNDNWWPDFLGRSRMSRTPVINQSKNFNYRVMVVSNYLSDAAKRKPFEVVR